MAGIAVEYATKAIKTAKLRDVLAQAIEAKRRIQAVIAALEVVVAQEE